MMTNPVPVIVLSENDNVAVARRQINAGEELGVAGATAASAIPLGHKIALRDIEAQEYIRKYGQIIGRATQQIKTGDHVHTQNMRMSDVAIEHHFSENVPKTDFVRPSEQASFMGYRRPSGRVGTRNYIAIISSVNCSATVSRAVAKRFQDLSLAGRFPNVDGVVAFTHGSGCSSNGYATGYTYLTRTLAGYARNPNVGGVLMMGLGCETNQISLMMKEHGLEESPVFQKLNTQDSGGTRNVIESACKAIEEMLPIVNQALRERVPASELTVALQCGGSDGYSGISANPALGYAVDLIVRHGGTAILSETPEIYGAEHLLTQRAFSPAVADALLKRIDWWRDYTSRNGAELDNNPSHGNKAGGLTTILEKSLGAVAKGGSTRLNAVYEFAEPVREHGLVFMDTPGNDPVAVTGQVAGGANLVCFTTGRGSTSGFKPAPCIKIASNTPMYRRMCDDMDIDAGAIITGDETIESCGQRIFQRILEVASGDRSCSEQFDYGDNEFVPWVVGAVM